MSSVEKQADSVLLSMAGAGTGAVSLTLGALRSISQGTQLRGNILATDLGEYCGPDAECRNVVLN